MVNREKITAISVIDEIPVQNMGNVSFRNTSVLMFGLIQGKMIKNSKPISFLLDKLNHSIIIVEWDGLTIYMKKFIDKILEGEF